MKKSQIILGILAMSLSCSMAFAERYVIELPDQCQNFGSQTDVWDCGANSIGCHLAACGINESFNNLQTRCPRLCVSAAVFKHNIGPAPLILANWANQEAQKQQLTPQFEVLENQGINDIKALIKEGRPPHALIRVGAQFGFPLIHFYWMIGYDEEKQELAYRDPSVRNGQIQWIGMDKFQKAWNFSRGFSYEAKSQQIHIQLSENESAAIPCQNLTVGKLLPAALKAVETDAEKNALGMLGLFAAAFPVNIQSAPTNACLAQDFQARGRMLIVPRLSIPQKPFIKMSADELIAEAMRHSADAKPQATHSAAAAGVAGQAVADTKSAAALDFKVSARAAAGAAAQPAGMTEAEQLAAAMRLSAAQEIEDQRRIEGAILAAQIANIDAATASDSKSAVGAAAAGRMRARATAAGVVAAEAPANSKAGTGDSKSAAGAYLSASTQTVGVAAAAGLGAGSAGTSAGGVHAAGPRQHEIEADILARQIRMIDDAVLANKLAALAADRLAAGKAKRAEQEKKDAALAAAMAKNSAAGSVAPSQQEIDDAAIAEALAASEASAGSGSGAAAVD